MLPRRSIGGSAAAASRLGSRRSSTSSTPLRRTRGSRRGPGGAPSYEFASPDRRPATPPWWGGLLAVTDGNRDARVAGRPVRLGRHLLRGLGVPGGIRGPRLEHVPARRRIPVPDPLPPAVDVGHRGQARLLPRAVVHLDLDRGDALVLGPRDAG